MRDCFDAGAAVLNLINLGIESMVVALWTVGLDGCGLDLESCAATGGTQELIYVSPKTGRAVSRVAGDPYRDRMLPLPAFLRMPPGPPPPAGDLVEAFRLTGYFLARHVYEPRGLDPPDARARLVALVARNHVGGAIAAAIVFASLRTGSGFVASTGVERRVTDVVQGLLVLALLIPPALLFLRHRRREVAATGDRT